MREERREVEKVEEGMISIGPEVGEANAVYTIATNDI